MLNFESNLLLIVIFPICITISLQDNVIVSCLTQCPPWSQCPQTQTLWLWTLESH